MTSELLKWIRALPVVEKPKPTCLPNIMDPSTWPIIKSGVYPLLIVFLYYIACAILGPLFMGNQGPYSLAGLLSVHNLILAFANLGVGCGLSYYMIKSDYSIWCQPLPKRCTCTCDIFGDERDMVALLIGIYHITRLVQLGEGIFYVVRRQRVPLIKIFHHSSMVGLSWAATGYASGGTTALMVAICCHTFSIIYGYYLIYGNSASFNTFASYAQVVQFILMGVLSFTSYWWDCTYPGWGSAIVALFVVIISIMVFADLSWTNDGKFTPATSISLQPTGLGAPWFIDRNSNPGGGDGGGGGGEAGAPAGGANPK